MKRAWRGEEFEVMQGRGLWTVILICFLMGVVSTASWPALGIYQWAQERRYQRGTRTYKQDLDHFRRPRIWVGAWRREGLCCAISTSTTIWVGDGEGHDIILWDAEESPASPKVR